MKKIIGILICILFLYVGIFPGIQGFRINDVKFRHRINTTLEDGYDFDKKIENIMWLTLMPSLSVCIIKNNSVKWSNAYGYANIRQNIPAETDHAYMVASISKTFTAVALLQLYEQGFFTLDDNVNAYLPFDLKNPHYPEVNITFRMLLSHHASLRRNFLVTGLFFAGLDSPNEWLEEILTPSGHYYIPFTWVNIAPGEAYIYSDLGFQILAYLVERISNQSYVEYCNEHILQPLNMSNSSVYLEDFDVEKIATPYLYFLGKYIPYPPVEIDCYGVAGLRTTVLDLSKYLMMHMNNGTYNGVKILENDTLKEMHTPQMSFSEYGEGYGLGWMIISTGEGYFIMGHSGEIPGGRAEMYYRTSDNTGIIFFWNQYRMITSLRERIGFNMTTQLLWQKANSL
jgi:CubicO group peptidase (beta-lactamase class C family)